MASRLCARPGCRAWAVRGKSYCWAHRYDELKTDDRDDGTDDRSLRAERFAAAVRAGRQDELIDHAVERILRTIGAETSLADEIGALRLILKRVITMDALNGDPRETATTVARLSDSIVRAIRAQRAISGDLADELSDALTTVLIELGLGEDS